MKMKFYIWLPLLFLKTGVIAQSNQPSNSNGILPNVIPASTEAASLGKFGEWPVSEYTGVPDISVPLYTVKAGNFELPVQLSYHAGGIKVDEVSSWVGAGWALNAGGAISRTIVDMADDWSGGLYVENLQAGGNFLKGYYSLTDTNAWVLFNRVTNQLSDCEPDIYYLNIGGLAAKFCVDSLGNFHSIPVSNIKIISSPFASTVGGTGSQTQWIIADDKGNTYYFGSNTPSPEAAGTIGVENSSSGSGKVELGSPTAWYVTQIITANRADTIYFNYTQKSEAYLIPSVLSYKAITNATELPSIPNGYNGYIQYVNGNETLYNGSPGIIDLGGTSKTGGWSTLSTIRWRGGSVNFVSNTARQDMLNSGGFSNMLDSVNVYNPSGTVIKTFSLKYAYINQRYFLDSLSESGQAGSPNLVQTFGYISPGLLPAIGNFSQDHWGFYNGAGNTTLLPPSTQMPSISSAYLTANREPNTTCMAYGTLNEISYPTGGHTIFSYGSNLYNPGTSADGGPPAPIVTTDAEVVGSSTSPYARYYTFTVPFAQNNASIQITFTNYIGAANSAMGPLPYVAIFPQGSSVAAAQQDNTYWTGSSIFPSPTPTPNANGLYTFTVTISNLSLAGTTYVLVASDSCPNLRNCLGVPVADWPSASATVTYSAYGQPTTSGGSTPLPIAGGLRVQQITNYNSDGSFANAKQYTYAPGNLLMYPQYVIHVQQDVTAEANTNTAVGSPVYCGPVEADILEETSTSQTLLGLTQGSIVGYPQVTEQDIDSLGNVNGYVNYYFSFFQDSLNVYNFDEMYPAWENTTILNPINPVNSFEYKRGFLLEKDVYKNNGTGTYAEIQSLANNYNYNDFNSANHYGRIRGLRVHCLRSTPGYNCPPAVYGGYALPNDGSFAADFGFAFYDIITSWIQHVTTTETDYDQNSQNPVVKVTSTYYDNPVHMNPTRTTTNISDGDSLTTLINYPQDYAAGTPFIDSLVAHNVVDIPIENMQYQTDPSGNVTVLGGKITTYLPDGRGLPSTIQLLQTTSPVALNQFAFSNTGGQGTFPFNASSKTAFSPDPRYFTRANFINYDNYANITQDAMSADMNHSYIWDYKRAYPIAKADRAAQSDIAYTSFEADGSGNWTIPDTTRIRGQSMTGNNAYALNSTNSITANGLSSSKTYIVSYWSQGSSVRVNGAAATAGTVVGAWTYYEDSVKGASTITITGSATIDELRLFPKGALMTTYTYAPLVGMTSQCTPTNYVTYYGYDGLGRLANVKDLRGNVIKTYQYNYKN
jgi:hypothetical protein